MISQPILTVLAILLSAVPFTTARPQLTDTTSTRPSAFWPWSNDPACASGPTACKTDCTAAVQTLCSKDLGTENLIETVGECTAWYLYQIGNTMPTKDTCFSAFVYINDAGKFGPDGCGGTFGGALGFHEDGNRTQDPAFAIYPKGGNGNCFKALGDNSPPLPQDMLPNGERLPIGSCPSATSRRRRDVLQELEGRQLPECLVEDLVWQAGCNAVCLASITASTWWSGPFVAVGWLACLGVCDATGYKLYKNCEKGNNFGVLGEPLGTRATERGPSDPCSNVQNWAFECPAIQQGMLSLHRCPGSAADPESAPNAEGSGGAINF